MVDGASDHEFFGILLRVLLFDERCNIIGTFYYGKIMVRRIVLPPDIS